MTIGDIVIGWPEGITLSLWLVGIVYAIAHDGEPKKGKYDASVAIIACGISFFILWWGGFFS